MYAAILVGVIIVAMSIFFVYSSDQAKMRGEAFGKALEFIQEDLETSLPALIPNWNWCCINWIWYWQRTCKLGNN